MKKYLALLLMVLCLSDVRAYADTHTHKICGESGLCDDNHPSHSAVEWVEWDGISELVYTNDEAYVVLSANAERSDILYVNTGKTLNLCLNGHTLSGKLNGEVIRVWEGGVLNICDCSLEKTGTITHSVGYLGTGIYNDGETSIYDITISGNTAEGYAYGGGITNREMMYVYGGRIVENEGEYGGAIFNWAKYKGSNSPTHAIMKVYGATITHNIGTGFGGGINNCGNLEIYDSYITNNTAEADGAGIYSGDDTILVVDNCEITGNVSQQSGGGIRNGGDAQIVSSSICRNEAAGGSGGGISSYKTMEIDGCTISENKNGGIWSGSFDLIITNSVISKNTDALAGAGIDCSGNLTIENSIIEYNSSRYDGGGISNTGGIYTQAEMVLKNVIIRGNTARNGAGIYSNCKLTLSSGTEISNNEATEYGGGITNSVWNGEYNSKAGGVVVIDGASIKNNQAYCGGGVYNGAPYGPENGLSILEIKNGSITQNTASSVGGVYQNGIMKIWGSSTVIDNSESDGDTSNVLIVSGGKPVSFGNTYTGNIGFYGGSRKRNILVAEGENYSLTANDVNRMSSDNPLYCVVYNANDYKGYLTYTPTPTPTPIPTPNFPNLGDIFDNIGSAGNMPLKRPALILSEDGKELLGVGFLVFEIKETGYKSITYEVGLYDAYGNKLELPKGCRLIFPYPEGITINNHNRWKITITHYGDKSTEVFSSEEGSIEFLPLGLSIHVSSLSPFVIEWEEIPEVDLPQTGDNSHIVLWLALLALAGTAILTLKRKTA